MTLQILGLILQIVGIVCACRLGARLCNRLYKRSQWAPLAVAGPIVVITGVTVVVLYPAFTFVTQTIGFWLLAFAGGIIVRARQSYTGQ